MPKDNWTRNPKKVLLVATLVCIGSFAFYYFLLVDVMGFDKPSIIAIFIPSSIAAGLALFYSYGKLKQKLAAEERHNKSQERTE